MSAELTTVDAAADAAAVVASDASVDAGGPHTLVLRWQAVSAASAKLGISLKAGAVLLPLGELDGTTDDGQSGTPKACRLKKTSSTSSTFACGGVPAYNSLTATLKNGELVVSRTTGVDGEKGSEKTIEVKRLPVTEGALRTLAYKPTSPKIARPKCTAGQVASSFTGEWRCAQMCTSDSDCKSGSFCDVRRDITPDGRIGALLESACEEEPK